MDREVFRKVGDTHPPLYATVRDDDGVAVDLTNATVELRYRSVAGGAWAGVVGAVSSPATGGRCYAAVPTLVQGDFIAHFKVTQSGMIYTVPDDGYLLIHILHAG